MLTKSHPLWMVDSGATNCVARNREAFVEYQEILKGSRLLNVGNNSKIVVLGIGTCQLHMCGGRNLILNNVLYAPKIRLDLVSVLALLKLGFGLNIVGSVLFGSGYAFDGFVILDCTKNIVGSNVENAPELSETQAIADSQKDQMQVM